MDRDEADAQFFRVKLSCQSYAGNPCPRSLKTILESVKVESRIHCLVASYLMYPICLHMKYSEFKIHENFAELAFRVLSQTLKRTNVTQFNTFLELYGTLCMHLDTESPVRKSIYTLSEEIKVEILSAISYLFKATDHQVVRQFYSDSKYKNQLGFLIFLLFKELGIKQGNKIPFLVINILMGLLNPVCQTRQIRYTPNKTLFNTSLHYDFLWSAVKKCTESYFIQKELIFFLPGVTSKLINFIISETNPSASLIAAVILTFANFVAYTCNNKFYKYILDNPCENPPPDPNIDNLQVELTKSWWEQTSVKLASLYVSVTQICIAHDNFKTRLCLLESAAVLLANCQTSLSNLTTALVDTLIVLSADSHQFVSNYGTKILTTFSTLSSLNSFNPMLLRIEDLAYSLPNVVHNLNDTNKLPVFRLLTGYLNLIGKTQMKIGNSNIRMKECLKNLIKTLTSVLEFDLSDDSLLSQLVIQSDSQEIHFDKPKIVFTSLGDISSHAVLDVLHSIGQFCVLESILGYIFELAEREKIRKELIFILNHLIVGSVKSQRIEAIIESVETIIPLYLQAEWIDDLDKGMYVLLRNTQFDEEANLPTILALKRRTMQQILILEGLGHFAIALGLKFQPFIATTIFPLLEKSNNVNSYIQAQSFDSLHKICSALNYSSVQTLIHSNADYITNIISLQFFQECTSQSALDVLQAVFRKSTKQLLPLLEDSVNYLLKSIRFYHSNDESVILLPTLVVISDQLFRWQQDSSTDSNTNNTDSVNATTKLIQEYRDYLVFYFPQPEGQENSDTAPMEEEQRTPELLVHTICIDIIDAISYYINFPTPRITGFAFKVLTNCLLALQTNMGKALPILHRIWQHLVSCIKTNAPVILIASLHCLTQLSHPYGHFLLSKVKKDIWLHLVDQLRSLSVPSRGHGNYYLHTQDFKIQTTMLQCLPVIALDLKIRFTEFHQLLAVYHTYSSLSQPKILRDTAIKGMSILAKINLGSVHILTTLLDPNEYGEVFIEITQQ